MSLLSLAVLLLAAPPADTWPEFRGPTGNGIAHASAKPPVSFGESENLSWKVPVHGNGWSSPVVWGNQVWVTTATETGTEYFALCFDRATGKVLHDLKLFSQEAPTDIRRYNTYASPTPALAEGRLYAHFGSHGTACVDTKTGKVIWDRKDIPCDHFRGPASSPILFDNKLYLLYDGFDRQFVLCLDAATGKTIWQKDRDLPYRNTGKPMIDNDYKKAYGTASVFTIDGKPQLVAPAAMGTIAYDPANGNEIWRVITDGMNQSPRPVLANDLIYLTAGSTSTLFAIKTGGTGNITTSHVAFTKARTASQKPSPLVIGETLYMVNDTGVLQAIDAKTGKEQWKESLGDKFAASPILANGLIYLCGESGKIFVVKPVEQYESVAVNKLDGPIRASPAAVGKDFIVRTYTHLYCFSSK
jgi:outer membrane protein assembly factor BamB